MVSSPKSNKTKENRMRRIFSINKASNATDLGLLVARVGIAVLMFTHGIPKLMLILSGGSVQFPALMGMSAEFTLLLAVFAEVFCSVLLLIGFATRLAVIPLITTMLVAALFIHVSDPFTVKEPALLYMLVYVVFLFTGSGKYSLDNLFQLRMIKPRHAKMENKNQYALVLTKITNDKQDSSQKLI